MPAPRLFLSAASSCSTSSSSFSCPGGGGRVTQQRATRRAAQHARTYSVSPAFQQETRRGEAAAAAALCPQLPAWHTATMVRRLSPSAPLRSAWQRGVNEPRARDSPPPRFSRRRRGCGSRKRGRARRRHSACTPWGSGCGNGKAGAGSRPWVEKASRCRRPRPKGA